MNLDPLDQFALRHIGPSPDQLPAMLQTVGVPSLDALIDEAIPASIRLQQPIDLPRAESESQYLTRLKGIARMINVFGSFIGLGYYESLSPCVSRPVVRHSLRRWRHTAAACTPPWRANRRGLWQTRPSSAMTAPAAPRASVPVLTDAGTRRRWPPWQAG